MYGTFPDQPLNVQQHDPDRKVTETDGEKACGSLQVSNETYEKDNVCDNVYDILAAVGLVCLLYLQLVRIAIQTRDKEHAARLEDVLLFYQIEILDFASMILYTVTILKRVRELNPRSIDIIFRCAGIVFSSSQMISFARALIVGENTYFINFRAILHTLFIFIHIKSLLTRFRKMILD